MLESALCSSLGNKIASYLPPSDIVNLESISQECRLYLIKSNLCRLALANSIIQCKNRKIKYFHRHIEHFEKLYHKIPE